MLELYIIRHGIAEKDGGEMGDEGRRLTKKGKEKMKEVAKELKKGDIHFDLILTSPLLRAKETAEIVVKQCGSKMTETDLLKPGAEYQDLIKYCNKLKGYKRIAVVGHEPFLSGFASYCLAKTEISFIDLKKGGVLMLDVGGTLKPGACVLLGME